MKKQIKQVRLFHTIFKSPVVNNPEMPPKDRIELRRSLMAEELKELHDAKNIVEAADAIGDMLYVLIGTAIEYGLADRLVKCFDEIQRSNMSKLDENGNPIFREDGKILKSKYFTPPDLAPIVFKKRRGFWERVERYFSLK